MCSRVSIGDRFDGLGGKSRDPWRRVLYGSSQDSIMEGGAFQVSIYKDKVGIFGSCSEGDIYISQESVMFGRD